MIFLLQAVHFFIEVFAIVLIWNWAKFLSPNSGVIVPFLAVLILCVIWGTFLAPKAAITLPNSLRLTLRFLVLALPLFFLLKQGNGFVKYGYLLLLVLDTLTCHLPKQ